MTILNASMMLLNYLRTHEEPTQEEAAAFVGCHVSTMAEHLKHLIRAGLITKSGKPYTTIGITAEGWAVDTTAAPEVRNCPVPRTTPKKRIPYANRWDDWKPSGLPEAERINNVCAKANNEHSQDALWHEARIHTGSVLRARRMG